MGRSRQVDLKMNLSKIKNITLIITVTLKLEIELKLGLDNQTIEIKRNAKCLICVSFRYSHRENLNVNKELLNAWDQKDYGTLDRLQHDLEADHQQSGQMKLGKL